MQLILIFFFNHSLLILLLALGMVSLANDWFFRFWVLFYVMVFTSLSPQLSLGLIFIPHVMASPQSGPFPSVAFKEFSDFILGHFGPAISLLTVIMLLLSMTNNTELLSLHFKQDRRGGTTSWIRCLSWAIKEQLGYEVTKTLFSEFELSIFETTITRDPDITSLAAKPSEFSQALELYPYNQRQKFTGT
jgi:hypothetical protein